jgi:ABC-type cobalamin/Fe3+-siderophores transport system ATPase subunit
MPPIGSWPVVDIDLEIKNYRCFPDTQPARITLRDGFTSLLGVNNSGKSSLLRLFYELRDVFARASDPNMLGPAFSGSTQGFSTQGVDDYAELFSNVTDRDIEIKLHVRDTSLADPQADAVTIRLLSAAQSFTASATFAGATHTDRLSIGGDKVLHLDGSSVLNLGPYFAAFGELARSIYIGPFRNAINTGSASYYDLDVGEAFINAWNVFKTGASKSNATAAVAVTEDIRRIFDFERLDINATEDRRSLQIFIDGQPYRLHELGAGLAHFIIVMAYAATRSPTYVLIDEPEQNLHPALQLDFLTSLGSYASRGVLFATHSIGLARASSHAIYSVQRLKQGVSDVRRYETIPRLSEVLGELSYSGFQELGFSKVLLVEGPTDVTAIQQLLRLHNVDHRVVQMPLGGATLINAGSEAQLQELMRISTNIDVLIDSERTAEGEALAADRQAFVDVCQRIGLNCHVLERRALENYFTTAAVQRVKGPKYRALGPFERREDVDPVWGKAENWRVAGEMSLDDLAGTDLGEFLQHVRSTA